MGILDDKEREIFSILMTGKPIKLVAQQVKRPLRTVQREHDDVLKRLRVSTTAGAVAKLLRKGELQYGNGPTGKVELACREFEVLHDIANGRTDKEIARRRHRSANTGWDWSQSLFDKLGVDNRTTAVVEGFRRKLLR